MTCKECKWYDHGDCREGGEVWGVCENDSCGNFVRKDTAAHDPVNHPSHYCHVPGVKKDDLLQMTEEQFEQDLIDRILMEDDKTLIGYFCMHIGYDWKDKPEHDPAIYPEWSAVTKAIWNEIERRMKGTVVHEFDYDGAIEKLTDKADGLRYHLHKPSAECSYYYGYVRALEEAKEIVRKARRSKRWKPKREAKNG